MSICDFWHELRHLFIMMSEYPSLFVLPLRDLMLLLLSEVKHWSVVEWPFAEEFVDAVRNVEGFIIIPPLLPPVSLRLLLFCNTFFLVVYYCTQTLLSCVGHWTKLWAMDSQFMSPEFRGKTSYLGLRMVWNWWTKLEPRRNCLFKDCKYYWYCYMSLIQRLFCFLNA